MSSTIVEQVGAADIYSKYYDKIDTLGLSDTPKNKVMEVITDFAESDPKLFEESESVFNYIIDFVADNQADIGNQNQTLQMEFAVGLFNVLNINVPEILTAYHTASLNGFSTNGIDLSKFDENQINSVLDKMNIPYLNKKDFLLGIVNSRLDGTVNDFVAVKLAGGIISFLNLLSMKLSLMKK